MSWHFYASTNVMGQRCYVFGLFVSVHETVHVSRTLLTQNLESIGHIFTKLSASLHFGTRMNTSSFGIRHVEKMHFLALLVRCLKNQWMDFH